jgi:hypothetical protein
MGGQRENLNNEDTAVHGDGTDEHDTAAAIQHEREGNDHPDAAVQHELSSVNDSYASIPGPGYWEGVLDPHDPVYGQREDLNHSRVAV